MLTIRNQKKFIDPKKDEPFTVENVREVSGVYIILRKRKGIDICAIQCIPLNESFILGNYFPGIRLRYNYDIGVKVCNNKVEVIPGWKFILRRWYSNNIDATENPGVLAVILVVFTLILIIMIIIINAAMRMNDVIGTI